MNLAPATLTGRVVRLEPLAESHVSDLTVAGQDEAIWQYMPYGSIRTEEQMLAWVRDLLNRQARGTDLPFAVIHAGSGRAVGATRYLDIQPPNRSLEIGGTWYAPEHRRTAVNTESKLLLLGHAFETLQCVRVQFKTDVRNERSQQAIERLGAVREGVLRDHILMPDGRRRSSAIYSILQSEWLGVKSVLEARLARGGNRS